MAKKIITRRDFLKAAAVTPLAGAIGCCCTGTAAVAPKPVAGSGQGVATLQSVSRASRVVLVRDENAVTAGRSTPR